jgi:branched-chain amino acid transport system permease protein
MVILQVIVGGLLLGAIYALFSSGLTLIWGMMNFINFAHGEFVMLGMYTALLVVIWLGGGPPVFAVCAALVARFNQIDGYRCLSLMRALAVVKCQSALA